MKDSTASSHGWILDLVHPDSTYSLDYAFGSLNLQHPFPDVSIAADDTATVNLLYWDSYLICKLSASQGSFHADTLFVHSKDSVRPLVRVPIDFTFYVGISESHGRGPNRGLVLYPNPARPFVTAVVDADGSFDAEWTIMDILGRTLYKEFRRLSGSGRITIALRYQGSPVAPGVYVFNLEADGNHFGDLSS